MECNVLDFGLIEYESAWKLQEQYAAEIAQGKRAPTLLLLEHPHVYTFGRQGHAENLLWGEEKLKEKGIAIHWVDRGGDVTYHGPGQLVGYPLIPLGPPLRLPPNSQNLGGEREGGEGRIPQADYVGYVRRLERMLIEALARLGLVAGQRSGVTGVWVQADVYSRCPRCRPGDRQKPAKIAAIGVKVDAHGISRHGFALNVAPDMSYWDGIIACGLADNPVVSLKDLVTPLPDMQKVKKEIAAAFGELFGYEVNDSRAVVSLTVHKGDESRA
jgi:lipoate-protein ligase B